jgi:hypothetical protein
MFGRNWMIMTGNNPMISMPPSSITPPSMPNFYHDIPQHQPYEQYHPSQGPPNYQQQQFMSTAPIHRLPAQPNSNLSQQQQFDLQQQMHRQTSAVSNPSWPLDGQQTQNAQLIQSSNRSQQRPQQPQRQQRPCSPSNKSSADGAVNNRENFDKEKARQELLVGLQTLLDRRPFPPTRFLDGPMTEQIEQYCAALEPLREDFDKHQKAVQFIQSILVRTFDKDCVVHQFGSTANGLCLRGAADMDVCIELSAAQRIACEEQRSIKEQAIMAEWEAAAVAAAAEQAEAEAETESFDEKEKISKSATDKGPQQQQHQPEISGETIPENEQAAAEGEEKKERRRKPKPLSLAQFVLSRLAEELEKGE